MFKHDRYIKPNGEEGDYFYLSSWGSVLIIPIRDDGKIILNRQFRYLFQRESLEFPAGGTKETQTSEEAAVAELAEEAGVKAENLKLISKLSVANGTNDEYNYVYVAWGLEEVDSEPDDTEEIERVYMTVDEVDEAITSGEMWDSFCIAPWTIARPFVLEIIEKMKNI